MKKKLLCLVLCLILVLPVLASCSSDDGELDENVQSTVRPAKTISLYLITSEETTDEAKDLVEEELNKLTKAKYTTAVELVFLTEDEYYSTLEESFVVMEEAKDAADKAKEEEEKNNKNDAATGDGTEDATTIVEETIIDEDGVQLIKYPALPTKEHIDVFMITDMDKYEEYVADGKLTSLNASLNDTFKKLRDYIYPTFFDDVTVNGNVYAVPNNTIIGECGYALIDRALAEEAGFDAKRADSIDDLIPFIDWVKANKPDVNAVTYKPVVNNTQYMLPDFASDSYVNEFSLVGAYGKGSEPENLFANEAYKNELLALAKINYSNNFKSNEKGAVTFAYGDVRDALADYENYEVVVVGGSEPVEGKSTKAMFAVSAYTTDLTRSMEVITFLNTDEEVRNLLQYGIEGKHYEIDADTDTFTRLNNDYVMNVDYTGNLYMTYPFDIPGATDEDIWHGAKMQNLKSKILCAFYDEVISETCTRDVAEDLIDASQKVKSALDAATTYEAYEAVVNGVAEKYASIIDAFLTREAPAPAPAEAE